MSLGTSSFGIKKNRAKTVGIGPTSMARRGQIHSRLPASYRGILAQEIVEAQVVALLANLPKAEATTDAVRRFLAEELSNGQPRLEQLAPRLHMSARTLHRRLEQEGTNFRRILSDVRRELALRHLAEGRLAIGEIAFLLGFSEVSAFHRAFKQWTGHAPHAYRASQHPFVKS
jgi:AraC-like DNA-binding protein